MEQKISFEEVLEFIDSPQCVLTTPENRAILESSFDPRTEINTDGMPHIATKGIQFVRLGDTPGGRVIERLAEDTELSPEQFDMALDRAMWKYALSARGNITVHVRNSEEQSELQQRLIPAVLRNPNVKTINHIEKERFVKALGEEHSKEFQKTLPLVMDVLGGRGGVERLIGAFEQKDQGYVEMHMRIGELKSQLLNALNRKDTIDEELKSYGMDRVSTIEQAKTHARAHAIDVVGGEKLDSALKRQEVAVKAMEVGVIGWHAYVGREQALGWRTKLPITAISLYLERRAARKDLAKLTKEKRAADKAVETLRKELNTGQARKRIESLAEGILEDFEQFQSAKFTAERDIESVHQEIEKIRVKSEAIKANRSQEKTSTVAAKLNEKTLVRKNKLKL